MVAALPFTYCPPLLPPPFAFPSQLAASLGSSVSSKRGQRSLRDGGVERGWDWDYAAPIHNTKPFKTQECTATLQTTREIPSFECFVRTLSVCGVLELYVCTNHGNAKSSTFANFVGEPGFNLNSPTFSRTKPSEFRREMGLVNLFILDAFLCCDSTLAPPHHPKIGADSHLAHGAVYPLYCGCVCFFREKDAKSTIDRGPGWGL